MPIGTTDFLMSYGLPHLLAELIGANPITQAGSGTTQGGTPTLLKSKSVELTTTGGNTAFIINSGLGVNEPIFVYLSSATTALVFVPVGHTLNGSLNGSLSVTSTNKSAWLWQYKKGFWASVLTA